MDDFFTRALLGGIGVALLCAPLGCFVVWRRMAYFGDTLAHSALLGVALSFLFEINSTLSVFVVSVFIALLLLLLQKRSAVPSDALLALMSHGALAIGLVALSLMTWIRVDLMNFLAGDILAISATDVGLIYGAGALILIALFWIWKPLLAATISPEFAKIEGGAPERSNLIFMVLLAVVIAFSIKIVGVLLVTALLVIPAATARRFSSGPEQMALIAAALGVISVVAGLFSSLEFGTMSGPSIVVASVALFAIGLSPVVKFFAVGEKL